MTAFGSCLPNTFQYRPKVCVGGMGGGGSGVLDDRFS